MYFSKPRHLSIIFQIVTIFVLIALMCEYVYAKSNLRLELGNRGMASVTVTIEPQSSKPLPSGAITPAVLLIIVLPFDLDEFYNISKRDDIEVKVILNGDDYCILTLMAPKLDTETIIRIDNAFNLVDERAQNRVKFSCDTTFRYLKQQRNILSHSLTISEFDITISLPKKYERHELSFEPSRNEWTEEDIGRIYTLKAPFAAKQQKPIWIAFPSPFEKGLHVAQLVTSIIVGLVILILQGRFAFQRKLGPKILSTILILSTIALCFAVYFCLTLANTMEFLAWLAGILIPIAFAPFICAWILLRTKYDAEISGSVTIDDEQAKYVSVSLYDMTRPDTSLKSMNVKDDGSYRFFYWCGNQKISAYVIASGSGTSREKSENISMEARKKVHVKAINIKRIEIRPTSPTSGQQQSSESV